MCMKRLTDIEWFSGIYRDIYKILSIDSRLPNASDIFILEDCDLTQLPPENVKGFALNQGEKRIWFRDTPPDPITFAHELIHCCKKCSDVYEEIYGYNLASFVVLLAELSITPKKNPLTLFEDVTLDRLLNAINRVYRYNFKSVVEYFVFLGIIPQFVDISWNAEGELVATIDKSASERDIVVSFITELAAGARYDPLMLNVLLTLLEDP